MPPRKTAATTKKTPAAAAKPSKRSTAAKGTTSTATTTAATKRKRPTPTSTPSGDSGSRDSLKSSPENTMETTTEPSATDDGDPPVTKRPRTATASEAAAPITSKNTVTSSVAPSPGRPVMLDAQTLVTMNDRLRNEVAQLRTELEHAERVVQMNMGRAPTLPNRACQTETTNIIAQYDNIRATWHAQLGKLPPSHPKYAWFEHAHHLNTEVCRLVRDSFAYRGFEV